MNVLFDEHQFRIFRRKRTTVLCHGSKIVRQMTRKEYLKLVSDWPEETQRDNTRLLTVWSLVEVHQKPA